MKRITLGILDLGSQTTAFYLNELNRVYKKLKGTYTTCPLILHNIDFESINALLPKPSDKLNKVVQSYLSEIEKTDINTLLVPNITLHETIDQIKFKKYIVHPVHICLSHLISHNFNKVFLFGSLYTMQSNYIRDYFSKKNIEILLPTEQDMQVIDHVRREVYAGSQSDELIKKYHTTIEKYSKNHPIVLACTELSIFKPKNHNVVDMAELQIEEAVKKVLSSAPR